MSLVPGDNVEVVEGELKGLEGKVISAAEETITVMPKHDDLKVDTYRLTNKIVP